MMARVTASPRPSPVTLRDVARAAGVHPGTVSRALNPATEGLVNPDTVRRVRAAADALGYRPNPMARGLKTNRTYTVGVLVPDIQNPLFPPIIRGIDDGLGPAGYTPLIANTDNDPERERTDIAAMRARQVDGLITATAHRDPAWLEVFGGFEAPLVLVNRGVADGSVPATVPDDREGARLAVRHLVELGHTCIAHLAGPDELSTGHERRAGFEDAMLEAGLEPVLLSTGHGFSEREGARLCAELLATHPEVTGVVAGNDLMALGCYDVLAERGERCPDRLSVVGFNDMPFADRFEPPLTTVRIPHYEIGVTVARLLLECLQDASAPPREVVVPVELVVRGSTAAP